jgi:pyruvate dehydrogenase E1 component
VKTSIPARVADVDSDPEETKEWLDALASVVGSAGLERARFLLGRLERRAQELGTNAREPLFSAHRNTISLERQGSYPGDLALEERITAIVRWNALAMVVRANKAYGELGGHIASYASAAEIFELGFNHFFRAAGADGGGDLVFFQPHSAPGVYARAFLEGRLGEEQLANYRQEVGGGGLCSYPHPWLMPDFWQFPTGSMGLGPIAAIYHARFMRYLEHRGLAPASDRHVWGVFGDGEMDEPESIAGLTLAARENLDNLTFVINCNLQRLDGPVRGNGQIIQELEALFVGAGWNVIKVLWGSEWDLLFARDTQNALLRSFAAMVDGEYQTLGANDGAYNQEHFFGSDPELRALAANMTHEEIDRLRRGGHDFRKLYAAFAAAKGHRGAPTVILAKTKKGFGVSAAESRMTAHQEKKLDLEALRHVRDRFDLPLDDDGLAEMRFFALPEGSRELAYLHERRAALGGYVPSRRTTGESIAIPEIATYAGFAIEPGGKEMSTTVALVRHVRCALARQDARAAHRSDRGG